MFKHFFTVAWRNIAKNKGLSLINIIGLSIGITTCIFITQYINYETSFENFHNNKDRIYRLLIAMSRENSTSVIAQASPVMAEDITSSVPEVERTTRLSYTSGDLVYEKRAVNSGVIAIADSTTFDIFTISLIEESKTTALTEPHSIVLSKNIATQLFGDKSPIGESVSLHSKDYRVTGVMADLPKNTSLNINGLISFASLYHDKSAGVMNAWDGNFSFPTYILLKPNSTAVAAVEKMNQLADIKINPKFAAFGANVKFQLQPLTDIRLYNNVESEPQGSAKRIYAIGAVALFILFIAGFNYVNLATALGSKRAKEVGLKKTVGCSEKQIRIHFLLESLFTLTVASLLSLLFVELLQPKFNGLLGLDLSLYASDSIWILCLFPIVILLFSFLAGMYPAFFLSRYKPLSAIKLKSGDRTGKPIIRNTLVTLQFTISSLLIIATTTVLLQLNYLRNGDKGIDTTSILSSRIKTANAWASAALLKAEVEKITGVEHVAISDALIGKNFTQNGYKLEDVKEPVMARALGADFDIIPTFNMQLVAGRNFSRDFSSDSNAIIINETLAKLAGWTNPLGKKIIREKEFTVIGVVKDYNYSTLHNTIEPVAMFLPFGNAKEIFEPWISIKIAQKNAVSTKKSIEDAWTKILPSLPQSFIDLSLHLKSQYRAEENFANLFSFFTLFAILISCLGLLGLTSFGLENRKKEIGIKKVLGANNKSITIMFAFDFTRWALIGTLLSWHIAYYFISKWLENFAYKIAFPYYIFAIASVLIYIIALIVIITQTIRAAKNNPADILRCE